MAAIALLALPGYADAAFPGQNGKIAYTDAVDGDLEIFVMNPDGTGKTNLTANNSYDAYPAWSPDGSKIAFTSDRNGDFEIYVMDAAGFNVARVTNNAASDSDPTWSPDGSRLAFTRVACPPDSSCNSRVYAINVDGSGESAITGLSRPSNAREPAWSPDGGKIALTATGDVLGVWLVNPDGSGSVQITDVPDFGRAANWSPDGARIVFTALACLDCGSGDEIRETRIMNRDGSGKADFGGWWTEWPAWSPDGRKIVFSKGLNCSGIGFFCSEWTLATRTVDGTGETVIPDTGTYPDWQPLAYPGYARPKGATPVRVSLVPAYRQCTAPDRTHGPPLAFGSCSGPALESGELTTGTVDSNGAAVNMTGVVRYETVVGNPTTPEDEADIGLQVQITDVRERGTLADYTGEVEARTNVRLTDRTAGGITATTVNVLFPLTTQCTPTANTSTGSTCSLTTTLDTLIPGAIAEGQRTVLQLSQVQVIDGGADGDTATDPNTVFLRQGILVP